MRRGFAGLIGCCILLLPVLGVSSVRQLPGQFISDAELRSVVGRTGCGQWMDLNGYCTGSRGCTVAASSNGGCKDPGATCGACTGGTNTKCVGPITMNGYYCAAQQQNACCTVSNACDTNIGGGHTHTCECSGTNGSPVSAGTQTLYWSELNPICGDPT